MALNDCFFFQLAWKTQLMFGDVLVQRWHWKKSRFERLSPLPESPVPRNRSGSVLTWASQRRHSRGTIYLTPEKYASLDNTEPEWSDERLSSKKKFFFPPFFPLSLPFFLFISLFHILDSTFPFFSLFFSFPTSRTSIFSLLPHLRSLFLSNIHTVLWSFL